MKNNKKIKQLLFIGMACAITIPFASLNTFSPNNSSKEITYLRSQLLKTDSTWVSKLNPKKDVTLTWNADITTNLTQMLALMNLYMQNTLYFTTKINSMTPYQLGMYLVNFYNANGGGKYTLIVDYKGKQDKLNIDYSQSLYQLIQTLDSANPPITSDTPKASKTFLQAAISIATKMNVGGLSNLISVFATYCNSVFGMSTTELTLAILNNSPTTPEQMRAYNIFLLLDALPSNTIQDFPNMLRMYSQIAGLFQNSELAKEWGADHNVSIANIDKDIVNAVLFSGN